MPGIATYDPSKVVLSVGGAEINGYADGEFINVDRANDTFNKSTGADNRTVRIKQNDFSGSITITLSQTSESNNILSAFMILDETTNDGIVPVLIKDLLGSSVYVSAYAWVRKPPAGAYGKDDSNREWVLDCANLDIFHGGNPDFQG